MSKHQVEIKQFIGALNLDDPIEVLGKGVHRDSTGIIFEGMPPNRRPKAINSNQIITNSLLPITGLNKTICEIYDPNTKRIFFLNYNSAGNHGIYVYNTIPGTFQRLVEVGINTVGDPLQFTATSHKNIDIIYGDATQGNILYFLDSLGRPSKINIDRALSGGYGNIQRSFLDVAKEPANIPPYCIYENDPSNTVNGLRKKQFKIKTRWGSDDQDKSVTSSQSEVAVPLGAFDQGFDSDPTKNCRLAITYQTGPANVKKIEILGAVSLGTTFSDFFLIASIDKAVEGLADNDLATYLFYNDKAYNYIDVQESIQLYDYLPPQAFAQTTLNGNVQAYGNMTEGYPNLSNFSFNSNTSSISSSERPYYYGNLFSNLIANQSGDSGFGTGNIHIVIRGIVSSPSFSLDTYTVYMTDGTTVTYTLNTGDDASAAISGLRTDAISKGYTIVSSGSNDLIISKSGISLARTFITSNYSYNTLAQTSLNAYDWLGKHGFGLVYFDQKGRTNGVVYTSGFSVNSTSYTESGGFANKPSFNATIYHVPPDWAYYFQWVRTKDLKKSNFQQWISDRTYKDLSSLSGQVKYAYVSIESLNVFVNANPGSPLGYGFTPGDRITFIKRYNSDGSTANIYGGVKDFEIVASATNPLVNGETRVGQFVKIILPSTDGSFDFGDGFFNYFIELYTPAQSVANGLDVYFQYGERYKIGNPTLSTRFHQGMSQNQTSDHLKPATYEFNKGDYYIRNRSVQTGNEFLFRIPETTVTGADFIIVGINFIQSTYPDSNITTQNQAFVGMPAFNPITDGRWFLGAVTVTDFHIKGTITWNFSTAQVGSAWDLYIQNRFGEKHYLVSENVENAGSYTFSFDTTTTLEDDHIFLLAQGSAVRTIKFLQSDITFTIDKVISQTMIDKNFSDYYPSSVNSNVRAFVYDPNANQVTYPNLYRWSLAYQTNTNINQTNRFYPLNFDETNRKHGGIMKMAQMGNELFFFLEQKIGHTGVFQKFITDNDDNNQLVTTNSIITQNNVQYDVEDIGVFNQATSVVQHGYAFYGVDPIRNTIWRRSNDGVTDLAELYKVKTWASQNLPKYLNPTNYTFGGAQKVFGTYNIRPDNVGEYLLLAQGGSSAGEIFAFEEKYNTFYGRLPIDCDTILCAENTLYMFRGGQLWKQVDFATKNNFFNVQYEPSILIPFTDKIEVKKIYQAIGCQAADVWAPSILGDVLPQTIDSQTNLQQQSKIYVQDFDKLELPNMYAAFNRDANTFADPNISLWEGSYLTGHYLLVKLRSSTTGANYLFEPFITYDIDPRNF